MAAAIVVSMSVSTASKTFSPHLVVIGGGATGTGIAREAAARGLHVTLLERGSLGGGTSGHFHGMLHSGARYVVNDPHVAASCYKENQRLRAVLPSAISATGGMFVALNEEESAHGEVLMHACLKAGIPAREITIEQALKAEPHLTHQLKRAFLVPDGFIDGGEVIRLNRQVAESANSPATFLEQHTVTGFKTKNATVYAVTVKDTRTNTTYDIKADYVINAAGVWSGRVASLAGVPFTMVYDQGTMISFKRRFSNGVLNRCRPEDDGDLLVTSPSHSIMGTTSRIIKNPDECIPTQEEVDVLLREGAALVPQLQHADVTKIYAGVRPLLSAGDADAQQSTRAISRSYKIIDHSDTGVTNMLSIIGGKVTLYRLMAEDAVQTILYKSQKK